LTTVRRAGYAPEVVAAWPGFPPDDAVPIVDAVRAREPVILESRGAHDARYPHLAGVHAEGTDGALVAIPLLLGERAVGGLGLSFPTTRRFSAEERAVMRALGELCAQALERARAQEDLRASEERYRAIAETANEGIWLIDRAARTLFANARLAALLGTTVDDVVARTVLDFVFEEDRPLAQERIGQNLAGMAEQFDFRFRRADGAPVQVLACTSPVHAADGTIVGALGMFSDITALRELERAREEFLSSAAHDLKTPLTSIRGQAQLAQRRLTRLDTPETAPALVQLARIQEGTDAMVGLIDELVDVTRQQMGGGLELQRAPVDLVALVQGSVEAHRDASGRPIHLEVAVSELHADVDAARVGRVVGNLLSNALKYSPAESAIWVRLSQEDGAAGPEAVLVVRDQGIGIPAADLAHIFDRFARAGNVVGHFQGTGIGLASARGIVEQHGGTIAVESTEGVGSTFTVRLPLADSTVDMTSGRATVDP
jgi:PAS domain S-box-containing protein